VDFVSTRRKAGELLKLFHTLYVMLRGKRVRCC
jgi:hypothetical protein